MEETNEKAGVVGWWGVINLGTYVHLCIGHGYRQ